MISVVLHASPSAQAAINSMSTHLRHPLPQPDGEQDANHRRERDGEGDEPIAEHCVSHADFDTSTSVSGEERDDAGGVGADTDQRRQPASEAEHVKMAANRLCPPAARAHVLEQVAPQIPPGSQAVPISVVQTERAQGE